MRHNASLLWGSVLLVALSACADGAPRASEPAAPAQFSMDDPGAVAVFTGVIGEGESSGSAGVAPTDNPAGSLAADASCTRADGSATDLTVSYETTSPTKSAGAQTRTTEATVPCDGGVHSSAVASEAGLPAVDFSWRTADTRGEGRLSLRIRTGH